MSIKMSVAKARKLVKKISFAISQATHEINTASEVTFDYFNCYAISGNHIKEFTKEIRGKLYDQATELERAVATAKSLIECKYELRALIAQANESSEINRALTELNAKKAVQALFRGLDLKQVPWDIEDEFVTLHARVKDKPEGTSRNPFGSSESSKVTWCCINEDLQEDLRKEVREVTKEIEKLEEKLAELNHTTQIEFDPKWIALLESFDIYI